MNIVCLVWWFKFVCRIYSYMCLYRALMVQSSRGRVENGVANVVGCHAIQPWGCKIPPPRYLFYGAVPGQRLCMRANAAWRARPLMTGMVRLSLMLNGSHSSTSVATRAATMTGYLGGEERGE